MRTTGVLKFVCLLFLAFLVFFLPQSVLQSFEEAFLCWYIFSRHVDLTVWGQEKGNQC